LVLSARGTTIWWGRKVQNQQGREREKTKRSYHFGKTVANQASKELLAASVQAAVYATENFTDFATEQSQNTDNDDGDKNQNKCVFYETLTFFLGEKAPQHNKYLLKIR